MIKLYERLIGACKTINQVNRVHIALENWMTPRQWQVLRAQLLQSPAYGFLTTSAAADKPAAPGDIRYVQQQWLKSLQGMYDKSGQTSPQAYERRRLGRYVSLYKNAGEARSERTLVVCFTGAAQRMMCPLPVFMQHIDAAAHDVVLIRYPKGKGYRHGLEGVADSFEAAVEWLSRILPCQNYSRVVAVGASGGGLPAVLTSLRLGFDAALTFGAGHPGDKRWSDALGYSGEVLVRRFFEQRQKKIPLFLVHGADMPTDRQAAEALGRLLPASIIEVKGTNVPVGHNSLYPLLTAKKLRGFLRETILGPKRRMSQPGNGTKKALPDVVQQDYERSLVPLTGSRYFGIGFNKTGTTTLGRCFEILGLTPVAEPRSKYIDFRYLSRSIFERVDFQPALHAADYFRAFQDRPWNIWDMYKHLDQKFAGSYFILTEREPESWWDSVERWVAGAHKHDKAKFLRYLNHLKVDRFDKADFIKAYLQYNDEVKAYFAGRADLLVMNLAAGDGWEKLCPFLGMPVPGQEFPHANKNQVQESVRRA